MMCDIRTLAVLQGPFLIPVLLVISCFNGIYSQSSLPGNPLIAGEFEKNEGELVTLSCTSLGGNPLPSVQWFKDSKLVDAGSSPAGNGDGQYTVGSSTVIYNNYTFAVSRSDNLVNYVCHVENSQTTAPLKRKWTITIYVPSEQPIITGPEPAFTTPLNAGSTYKFVCTARNGRPVPSIKWKLGTALSSAIELDQGITENTTTNSDSTLSKTTSLSWVPITDDNGKNLYCQTNQTIAGGHTTQRSTFVSIVVQEEKKPERDLRISGAQFLRWTREVIMEDHNYTAGAPPVKDDHEHRETGTIGEDGEVLTTSEDCREGRRVVELGVPADGLQICCSKVNCNQINNVKTHIILLPAIRGEEMVNKCIPRLKQRNTGYRNQQS